MDYFVVMENHRHYGLEAIVHPELKRADIIARIRNGDYSNIVRIDCVKAGKITDVTAELHDAARELEAA